MLSLFVVLFHRVGLIILFISATVLLMIPQIYTQESDDDFAQQLSHWLRYSARSGFILLIITGLVRLTYSIPQFFWIKACFATVTTYWLIFHLPAYPSERYLWYHGINLVLICLTAIIGILL